MTISIDQENHETTVYLSDKNDNMLMLYISYTAVVGFSYKGETYCMSNYWSTTTGKFLNKIEPDKRKRISREAFEKIFSKIKISISLPKQKSMKQKSP